MDTMLSIAAHLATGPKEHQAKVDMQIFVIFRAAAGYNQSGRMSVLKG
jgi:hypothetical protein